MTWTEDTITYYLLTKNASSILHSSVHHPIASDSRGFSFILLFTYVYIFYSRQMAHWTLNRVLWPPFDENVARCRFLSIAAQNILYTPGSSNTQTGSLICAPGLADLYRGTAKLSDAKWVGNSDGSRGSLLYWHGFTLRGPLAKIWADRKFLIHILEDNSKTNSERLGGELSMHNVIIKW